VIRTGTFGILPAEIVTPLAMALGELLQNAVEHGGGADVALLPRREDGHLVVDVVDRGPGIPEGFDPFGTGRLGLQIVRTLITEELGGELELCPAQDGHGTRARVSVPLPG
jgi:two-component sensor histidine kinase